MQLHEQFRPGDWTEVVGQDKAVALLRRLEERGELGGKAYFFSGPSGSGKTTLARIIARKVSDSFATDEMDAADLTADYLRTIPAKYAGRPLGGRGWAIILNEVHGLNREQIRRLLTVLEPEGGLPPYVVWCFTTTNDGADRLFDDCSDASPLLSRCQDIPLARRDLAKAFAERARAIAQAAGLDGQPIERYIRLAQQCRNNLREMLQVIERGGMLAKSE